MKLGVSCNIVFYFFYLFYFSFSRQIQHGWRKKRNNFVFLNKANCTGLSSIIQGHFLNYKIYSYETKFVICCLHWCLPFLLDPWVKLFLNKVGMTPRVIVALPFLCIQEVLRQRIICSCCWSYQGDLFVVCVRLFCSFILVVCALLFFFLIHENSTISLESWKRAKIKMCI